MVFRRIYWVTEQLDDEGRSAITGIYTSIPDLLHIGMRMVEDMPHQAGFRLSLVQLDQQRGAHGIWTEETWSDIASDLSPYIRTGEFTEEQCLMLQAALQSTFSKS
ncbi:MAG: hypothetical protein ACK4P3_07405 [Fimbriimonadaceae bacterium]|jgi:hypothetical protein